MGGRGGGSWRDEATPARDWRWRRAIPGGTNCRDGAGQSTHTYSVPYNVVRTGCLPRLLDRRPAGLAVRGPSCGALAVVLCRHGRPISDEWTSQSASPSLSQSTSPSLSQCNASMRKNRDPACRDQPTACRPVRLVYYYPPIRPPSPRLSGWPQRVSSSLRPAPCSPAPLAMRRRPARAAALEAKPVRHPSRTSTRSPPRRGRWHGPACLRGCQCQPSSAATPGLPFVVDLPRSVKSPSIRPPVSRPAVSHGDDRGLARRGSCQMQQNRTP